MVTAKEQFSASVASELLEAIREIAEHQGTDFEAALEEAIRLYIASNAEESSRSEAMAHYRASVEKNRRLAELLAQ